MGYAFLPGILPRVRAITGEGFGFIPFCMANIFVMCRLLPTNHAYLNPVNIGKFGIRHVLAQAAMNLKPRVGNIDQMVIFLIMLAGTVLLVVQFLLFALSSYVQVARAQSIPLPTTFAGFFISPDPTNDISYMVMDRIFGIPDFFESCVEQNIPCIDPANMSDGPFPSPFHLALGEILAFYSYGLLLVAVIILCYYAATIISETILSGTPFGKRFHRVWAPLRLVIALGLLLPMNHNLNAAQWITLYVTKFGSAFATNGWNFFLTSMASADTIMGARDRLIARPEDPGLTDIMQFMMMATVCKEAYRIMYSPAMGPNYIKPYVVRTNTTPASPVTTGTTGNPRAMDLIEYMNAGIAAPLYTLQEWAGMGDIHIVFGHYDDFNPDRYQEFKGGISPYCGEIVLDSKRIVKPTAGNWHDGADSMAYNFLIYFIRTPWVMPTDPDWGWGDMPDRIIRLQLKKQDMAVAVPAPVVSPTQEELTTVINNYRTTLTAIIDTAYNDMVTMTDWTNTAATYGWAGAAIWYNKIAEHNGAFTDAVFNLPRVLSYPEVLEWVQDEKAKQNAQVTGATRFDPLLTNGEKIELEDERDREILSALNVAYKLWLDDPDTKPAESTSVFVNMIDAVFKKTGLWSLRTNENIHPLASMASLGRAMLINSVVSFGSGTAAGMLGTLSGQGITASMLSTFASLAMTVAFIGLSVGIMLYYVVPFLPFIYFFFALVSWAKTIFEAMVGVPLWALAHLRYDGQGFPTRQSLYGYYLLIDIFLRPILSVFGLIASIVVFYALARTLNGLFNLVVSNISGFNMNVSKTVAPGLVGAAEYFRNSTDKMFYTIIYAVIIYMIGMSAFKMIDQIPNHILRWMGGGAKSFGEMTQRDSGREMSASILSGSQIAGQHIGGAVGAMTRTRFSTEGGKDD